MIELPESRNLSRQLNDTIKGKKVLNVATNKSPHKFAWFRGNPAEYHELLAGKTISGSAAFGGMAELYAGSMRLVFSDGINLRYIETGGKIPDKHQLLIEFDDFSSLACSVQMYGALLLLGDEETERYNEYARQKINPLSDEFDEACFRSLYIGSDSKLSVKAFLATNQRIPGLGNGVLQDILFNAGIHPKRKMGTLSDTGFNSLYHSVKSTLSDMTAKGGRDTEKDIFGRDGGYMTLMSNKTKDLPCPVCGNGITREAYMGGNIYFCPKCQPI